MFDSDILRDPEKVCSSFKNLLKQIEEMETELWKTADEIQTVYVETCKRIVRQDYFQEIYGLRKTLDNVREYRRDSDQLLTDEEKNESMNNEVKIMASDLLNKIKREFENDQEATIAQNFE